MPTAAEALVRKYGQKIPLAELQRSQAVKRGTIPAPPPEPGTPRKIQQYDAPTEPQVRKMRDQLMMLERRITSSNIDKWEHNNKIYSKEHILRIIQDYKGTVRNSLAQYASIEKHLKRISSIETQWGRYKAHIEKGKVVFIPPPGMPKVNQIYFETQYAPPGTKFQDSTGKHISKKEALDLARANKDFYWLVEGYKIYSKENPLSYWTVNKAYQYAISFFRESSPSALINDVMYGLGLKSKQDWAEYQAELFQSTGKAIRGGPSTFFPYVAPGLISTVGTVGVTAVAGKGLGYLTGISPKAATTAKVGTQILGAYVAGTEAAEITTLMKQGKYEDAANRGIASGIQIAVGIKTFGPNYRKGLIAGYRKRVLSKAITATEKKRINDIFNLFKAIDKMPAGKKTIIRITDVEKLSADDVIGLTKFLKSPEGKSFHIILGGSGANPVPGRMPHDIDMAIGKYRVPRPQFKGFGLKRWETSRVKSFTDALGKYISKQGIKDMDIHDAEKVGDIFSFKGKTEYASARVRKPVKTAEGPFKLQTGIKEQLQRKLASMLAPAHELRGKDWDDFLALFKQKIDIDLSNKLITSKQYESYNTLLTKVTKYKPTIKNGKLIAPAKLPTTVELEKFTRFERFIRTRTEKPVFTSDIQKFVPQMIDIPKKLPILTRILIRVIGAENTAKLLYFLKPPEGEKLFASFGIIGEKTEPYKPPIYISSGYKYKPHKKQIQAPYVKRSSTSTKTPYATRSRLTIPTKPITLQMLTRSKPTVTPTPTKKPVTTLPFVSPILKPIKQKTVVTTTRKPELPLIKRKVKEKQGYDTWGKKQATTAKRQWVKINEKPLKERQALGLGAKSVDESVSRTFKITKSKKPSVSKPQLDNEWYQRKHKFRKPIKHGKVQKKSPLWIEKSKHLIDSPNEFKGITMEGWKAIQAKKQQRMFMYTGPPKRGKK